MKLTIAELEDASRAKGWVDVCARRRKMFNREDNTYNEIREKSLFQWLDEMEKHEDIAVRGGVKLTREYIQHLKR